MSRRESVIQYKQAGRRAEELSKDLSLMAAAAAAVVVGQTLAELERMSLGPHLSGGVNESLFVLCCVVLCVAQRQTRRRYRMSLLLLFVVVVVVEIIEQRRAADTFSKVVRVRNSRAH